jgi:cytochrome c-type biogenesis protein CcmH
VRLATLTLLLVLALAGSAAAVPPRASLPDLEDEVMCVECGTLLAASHSPVAQQERAFINTEIAAGKDKQQIKAAMVQEYGENVLGTPQGGGFNSTLWIVPIVLVLLAASGVVVAARRWRSAPAAPEVEAPPALSPEDARRLDAELRR